MTKYERLLAYLQEYIVSEKERIKETAVLNSGVDISRVQGQYRQIQSLETQLVEIVEKIKKIEREDDE